MVAEKEITKSVPRWFRHRDCQPIPFGAWRPPAQKLRVSYKALLHPLKINSEFITPEKKLGLEDDPASYWEGNGR